MTDTWTGFKGQVTDQDWPRLTSEFGYTEHIISGGTGSAVSGGTRQVAVVGTTAYAFGVRASMDPRTVAFASVTSGVRYDALCLRYDWPARTVTYAVVAGGSTAALPGGLSSTPGSVYDVPLMLVKITAGSTVPVVTNIPSPGRHDHRLYGDQILTGQEQYANTPGGERWPNLIAPTVYVPRWANYIAASLTWAGVTSNGAATGTVYYKFGTLIGGATTYKLPGASGRDVLSAFDKQALPAAMKGMAWPLEGWATGAVAPATAAQLDAGSSFAVSVDFSTT